MRGHARIGLAAVAVVAVVGAVALALALRADDSGVPTEDELAGLIDEINKEVPNVGLGEGTPPPDAAQWRTDFSKRLVPLEEFQSGGPSKDGIPAIDQPRYRKAEDVGFLEDREPVILVTVDGESRAYPLQILVWHEIVNTRVGDVPVAVTFCPLCNTAIVFDRRVDGRLLDFGTTGKLRDSDLVMYDRQTESWWQQFGGDALVGDLAGKELIQLPARIVSWKEFRREHSDGLVLSRETGFVRQYGVNPYPGYDRIDSPPLFPTRNANDDRLPPKERVVYLEVGDEAYVVPFSTLARKRTITIDTADGTVVVRWRPGITSALDEPAISESRDAGASSVLLDGDPIPFHEPFWFAVAAFASDAKIVG